MTQKLALLAWKSMVIYNMRGANWPRYLAIRGWTKNSETNKWSHPEHPGNEFGWLEISHRERERIREQLTQELSNVGMPIGDGRYQALPDSILNKLAEK